MEFRFVKIDTAEVLDKYVDDILHVQKASMNSLLDGSWYIQSTRQDYYDRIEKQNGFIIVAIDNARVAGVIASGVDEELYNEVKKGGVLALDKDYLYACSMCVDSPYVGYGLQRKLISKLIACAEDEGLRGCWYRVHPDNIYAIQNIENAGFKLVGHYTAYNGWARDIYSMKFN
jgi:ribosomal protein S18 acetylase RimI-like enzyme